MIRHVVGNKVNYIVLVYNTQKKKKIWENSASYTQNNLPT